MTELISFKSRKQELLLKKLEADASRAQLELRTKQLLTESSERNEKDRLAREAFTGHWDFTDSVNGSSAFDLVHWLEFYQERHPGKPILLNLTSFGGSIFHGLKIIGAIREARQNGHHVTGKVQGFAASMAGVILQACDKRVLNADAELHLHEASTFMFDSLKSHELKQESQLLERLTRRCLAYYADRSSKWTTEDLFKRIEGKEWWLNAKEALEQEFADEVV